jgi:hypothetical protein
LAVLALGFGVSYLIYGREVIDPILYAGERPSIRHSIFRFLRGRFSPLPLAGLPHGVDFLSAPLMVSFLLFMFIWHISKNMDLSITCLLIITGILLLYRVGHSQLHVNTIFLGYYWYACGAIPKAVKARAGVLGLIFLVWISVLAPVYQIIVGYELARETLGVFTFTFGAVFWVALFRAAVFESKCQSEPDVRRAVPLIERSAN